MKTNVVKVKLWGTNVGYLSWDSREEVAVFEYDPSFLKLGWDIAPLTMPVNASRSRKQMPWLGNKKHNTHRPPFVYRQPGNGGIRV